MGKKVTLEETNAIAEEILKKDNFASLYQEKIFKRTGKPIGSDESYQEIYARKIRSVLSNRQIPKIKKSGLEFYCEKERIDKKIVKDNEEKIQRDFFFDRRNLQKQYGKPIWFELQTGERGQGKGIDLVYYNYDDNVLHIFELKYKNNSDTLLNSILKIQTYYQRVDWEKALRDLSNKQKEFNIVFPCLIKKHLLIDKKSFDDFPLNYKIKDEIAKLMNEFEIDIVFY